MLNSIDTSGFDADDFLRVPNYPDDPDSAMLREFVEVAIDEGLAVPLAVGSSEILIFLPGTSPMKGQLPTQ